MLLMFHNFLVARRFWGLTYSAGSALYQILQEMAFGTRGEATFMVPGALAPGYKQFFPLSVLEFSGA